MTDVPNWKQIITDLRAKGYTHYKIALLLTQSGLRTQQAHVDRWANGGMPRYNEGQELLTLHATLHVEL